MFVITADQRVSTGVGSRVEWLTQRLAPWTSAHLDAVALPLERTVGDEVRTVVTTPEVALDLALTLVRIGGWSVGIGAGPDEPLGVGARESSDDAFVASRAAVERAKLKSEPVALVVAGTHHGAAEAATAVVQMLAGVVQRRSVAGWEVADLLARGRSQREAAARLEISEQAVSQRVAAAMINEERRVRPVAARLIDAAGR